MGLYPGQFTNSLLPRIRDYNDLETVTSGNTTWTCPRRK